MGQSVGASLANTFKCRHQALGNGHFQIFRLAPVQADGDGGDFGGRVDALIRGHGSLNGHRRVLVSYAASLARSSSAGGGGGCDMSGSIR